MACSAQTQSPSPHTQVAPSAPWSPHLPHCQVSAGWTLWARLLWQRRWSVIGLKIPVSALAPPLAPWISLTLSRSAPPHLEGVGWGSGLPGPPSSRWCSMMTLQQKGDPVGQDTSELRVPEYLAKG